MSPSPQGTEIVCVGAQNLERRNGAFFLFIVSRVDNDTEPSKGDSGISRRNNADIVTADRRGLS